MADQGKTDQNRVATAGCVQCRTEGPLGWLLIDNPRRMNAISLSMWRELEEGAAQLAGDPAVRVVLIAGADGRNFCAGGDISEFASLRADPESMQTYDVVGKAAMERVKGLEKPTIAVINGHCLGGGLGLAVLCDLRLAADDAKLGIPAAKRAVSYDYPGLRRLVGIIGPSAAKHMLFTGEPCGAEEALRTGLVNEVLPAGRLHDHAIGLATKIAANAPLSVAASKFIIDMIMSAEIEHDEAACQTREAECLASADYAEATRSFMERRAPVFTGR